MVIKYIFLVFLQVDLHKIAKSMNFYHDINSGTFLNIRSHRVDGSSPNHTYIVRIYVNPHNIILIMYAYLCASSLNYTYIVRILVCIVILCVYSCAPSPNHISIVRTLVCILTKSHLSCTHTSIQYLSKVQSAHAQILSVNVVWHNTENT